MLDTLTPDTFITHGPGTNPELSPITFTFGSDEIGVGYLCTIDADDTIPCLETSTFDLEPGTHVLEVVAVDPIGRIDPTAATRSFTVAAPIQFQFEGFESPVDAPQAINNANAGKTISIRFVIPGDHGREVIADGSPSSVTVPCDDFGAAGSNEPANAPGSGGINYQSAQSRYHFNWQTSNEWESTCRRFEVELTDGGVYTAWFQFT